MFEPHSSVRSTFINSDKRSPRAGFWEVEVEGFFASINIFALTSKNRRGRGHANLRKTCTRVWQVGQCCTTNILCVSFFF